MSSIGPVTAGSTQATPSRLSQPGTCGPSESRTRPSPGAPLVSSSSPKTSIAAVGRGRTSNSSSPLDAARPMTAGVIGVPAGSNASPRCASSPGSRHSRSGRGSPRTRSPSTVESSMRTIASVPAGTIAPVAMLDAGAVLIEWCGGRAGQHLSEIAPWLGAADGPTVDGRRRKRRQVGQWAEVGGERRTVARGQRQRNRWPGGVAPGPITDLARPGPRHGDGFHGCLRLHCRLHAHAVSLSRAEPPPILVGPDAVGPDAGRATIRSVVAAAELIHCVRQDRSEYGQAVARAAGGAGQVHDQRTAGHPGQPTGEYGRRHGSPGNGPKSPRRSRAPRSREAPGSPRGSDRSG